MGFNPCFNGSIFQTPSADLPFRETVALVSILVLMEVSFRLMPCKHGHITK